MTGNRDLFRADWVQAVFVHFSLPPELLQPRVPLELDPFEGRAYVSLVAFTQARLRPRWGGRLAEWLSMPLARHEFLNLRTYVRNGDERGIYFVSEWIPNRLAAYIGPRAYGLPYRLGKLRYRGDLASGWVTGDVRADGAGVRFRGRFNALEGFERAQEGTLDHFLLERYIAFTMKDRILRRFEVHHLPWEMARVDIDLPDLTLVERHIPELKGLIPTLAHVSPGTFDVRISMPEKQTSHGASCTLWAGPSGARRICPKPMSIPPS